MDKTQLSPLQDVRVIGIFAHIDAGKTTTSEAILYYTGRIHRIGSVDEGSTQLDWMEQERARGITITAAATTCQWRDCRIHLIDTPGHIDFTAEVIRSIRVIDGAVVVLCGVGGVETQTETVWRHADRQTLPRLIFVNKLDRETADFEAVVQAVHQRLTPHALALQIPLNSGGTLRGVVDLLDECAWTWDAGSEEPQRSPIPAELSQLAAERHTQLVDTICETDETLLAERLDGREPGKDALRAALRQATIAGQLVPVLCGSARQRIGIQPLLDAISAYLPAPLDRPAVHGYDPLNGAMVSRPPDPSAPLCASAFKIVTDPHVGHLTWVRVFSGNLQTGATVFNPRTGELERVGRIYQIHANRRQHAESMQVGDVVALVGPRSAVTGDTLCDPQMPLALEAFTFPDAVISVAVQPSMDEERDRLHQCISHLCKEDPTLHLSFDAETGEHVLSGMGELHLEITLDRLRSEYGILARASPLQIAYRETVQHRAEATGTYRKQSGGHGHFAVVRLRAEPLPRGTGITFNSLVSAVELPDGLVRATEAGARQALEKGVVAGYPLSDVALTLVSGKYHENDSNSLDFRIAGSMAARQAVRQAAPILLEPLMRADIRVDEDCLGVVIGDFLRRRGSVSEMAVHGRERTLLGEVPLAEVRGYATSLRDMSQGRGAFTLEFLRYETVPERQAEQIILQRQARRSLSQR